MLMYQSSVTRKLIKDEGTTPAHRYASRLAREAVMKAKAKTKNKTKNKNKRKSRGIEH